MCAKGQAVPRLQPPISHWAHGFFTPVLPMVVLALGLCSKAQAAPRLQVPRVNCAQRPFFCGAPSLELPPSTGALLSTGALASAGAFESIDGAGVVGGGGVVGGAGCTSGTGAFASMASAGTLVSTGVLASSGLAPAAMMAPSVPVAMVVAPKFADGRAGSERAPMASGGGGGGCVPAAGSKASNGCDAVAGVPGGSGAVRVRRPAKRAGRVPGGKASDLNSGLKAGIGLAFELPASALASCSVRVTGAGLPPTTAPRAGATPGGGVPIKSWKNWSSASPCAKVQMLCLRQKPCLKFAHTTVLKFGGSSLAEWANMQTSPRGQSPCWKEGQSLGLKPPGWSSRRL
mmetsp:Transcript_91336/g.295430  ORF Transcript_91336/g.295430 Transcript_91336/m.295430 type:complete len:345 (-) Transcript_91336:1800-2834(-)